MIKKNIPLYQGTTVQMYERDGTLLNTSPIDELMLLEIISLEANKTAFFSFKALGFELLPQIIVGKFNSTKGNVTLTTKREGIITFTMTINGDGILNSTILPQVPLSNDLTLEVLTQNNIDFLWITGKPVTIYNRISPNRIV